MVSDSAVNFFAGIWLTQFGYPLAHRQQGVRDCISSDRLTTFAFGSPFPSLAVAEAKDHEVGELVFFARDVVEARTDAKGAAEACPQPKDGVAGVDGLLGVGGGGDFESSPEIRVEAVSGRSWSRCQGRGCG